MSSTSAGPAEQAYGDPATRKRILDAAWALVEESGTGVGVGDVAARAGVSRQAVYLHFKDRASLFVAVGDHIDYSLGRDRLREYVFGAPTGAESMRRWVETMSWYTAKIDSISLILEQAGRSDEALHAAWKDRMSGRRGHVGRIAERLASDGDLGDGWTAETARDLIYAITLPGPWRVHTTVLGWSQDQWARQTTALLERSLLRPSARTPPT